VDVKDIKPSAPVKPVRRRWHAPDEPPKQPPDQSSSDGSTPDKRSPRDGHIDEYA